MRKKLLRSLVPCSFYLTLVGGMIVDESELVGGGPPVVEAGHVDEVLFRSSTCPTIRDEETGRDIAVCSGNGICATSYYPFEAADSVAHEIVNCKCYDGYAGADCSLRVCPSGVAWADFPFANDTAHKTFVECSGFGMCNRATGICKCRDGYTGEACQRHSCPMGTSTEGMALSFCSGHGMCLNLEEAARFELNQENRADPFDGIVRLDQRSVYYYDDWDDGIAMMGCLCDAGFEGHDCSLNSCPTGDDPLTYNQTDEEQILECACYVGMPCDGSFRLRFRGQSSRPLPYNSSAELLLYELERIPTISISGLRVESVETSGFERPLCSARGESHRITFLIEHGRLPALEPLTIDDSLDVRVVSGGNRSYYFPWVAPSVSGTKEEVRCSGRGTCDRRGKFEEGVTGAGTCHCYDLLGPSDKKGGEGFFNDCGHNLAINVNETFGGRFVNLSLPNTTVPEKGTRMSGFGHCPVAKSVHSNSDERILCSGRGYNCSAKSNWKCNCTAPYTGPGCEYMDCPASRSWWQEPKAYEPWDWNRERARSAKTVDLNDIYTTANSIGKNSNAWKRLRGQAHERGFKCSNGGTCDETTGQCTCDERFNGVACHLMPCPFNTTKAQECNGFGSCWTLSKMARYARTPAGERMNISYTRPWDAFKIRLCNCGRPFASDSQLMTYRELDRPPLLPTETERTYRGPYAYSSTLGASYDCSEAECPRGDDVFTPGVNEIQEVRCQAVSGRMKMLWRDTISPDIYWNYGREQIKEVFEFMLSVGRVEVWFGRDNNATTACGPGYNHSFFVEFMTEFGELPLLIPITKTQLGENTLTRDDMAVPCGDDQRGYCRPAKLHVRRWQKGTKENIECSGQGICDRTRGMCTCMDGLASGGGSRRAGHHSYGTNQYGHRGDCGFRHADTKNFNKEQKYIGGARN